MTRVANSLVALRAQANAYAPHRRKDSDGTIGDASHAKLGSQSDHNPWYRDTVTALDLTHSPSQGLNCDDLAKALVYSNDRRIKYIIFDGQIYRAYTGHRYSRMWATYTGKNAHKTHLHLSVVANDLSEVATNWNLWTFNNLRRDSWNPQVGLVQERLNNLIAAGLVVDHKFGPLTEKAVRYFQSSKGFYVDGIVGPITKLALGF